MNRLLLLLMLLWLAVPSWVVAQDLELGVELPPDSLAKCDTVGRKHWKWVLRHGEFDINDTTVVYPRFLDFCLDAYRLYDRLFDQYDTTYVAPTNSKWKFHIKYNGLFGTYHWRDADNNQSLFLNTDVSSSVGVRVQYKGFGIEYAPDIDNLLSGRALVHRKTRFTYYNSRLALEGYYIKSSNTTHIHRFANYNDRRYFSLPFEGVKRRMMGLDAFYFFNYGRYAHTAAYTFSKIQRRSTGSFLLGLQISKQEADMDFTKLPEPLLAYVDTTEVKNVSYQMLDYAVNFGYGYNWVFHKNWLLNVTALPSLGVKRASGTGLTGRRSHLGINFRGRIALIHYKGKFYDGLNGAVNSYLFNTRHYNYNTSTIDFNAIIGFQIGGQ